MVLRKLLPGAVLAALMAGCAPAAPAPTLIPTQTPTPRSTPLPALTPTPVPGTAANPVLVAGSAPNALAQALADRVPFEVEPLQQAQPSALIELACAADSPPALLVLDGLSYAVAADRGCADVLGTALPFGTEVRMIARRGAGISQPAQAAAGTLCRLSAEDPVSWVMAVLMLRAEGVDLGTLRDVRDMGDADALLRGIASGECDVAVLPQAALEDASDSAAIGDALVFPEQIVLATRALPLAERAALSAALQDAGAYTEPDAQALAAWLQAAAAGGLVPAGVQP